MADILAGVLLSALGLYALTGGADFGGGVWDLLAGRGPRGDRQRKLIAKVLAPIWEANHVWLILVVVLLFVCFPRVFAAISIALHIPLTIMLFGITLRGSAFVFRAYGAEDDESRQRWGRAFAISSVISPIFLGICLGAAVSGSITFDDEGAVATDFVSEWLAPFPVILGFFILSLFAFLAAVYLIHECDDDELRDAFRVRALGAGAVAGVLAFTALGAATTGAPTLAATLTSPTVLLFHLATGGAAVGALWALWSRHYRWARRLAIVQVGLVVCGLGVAQYPWLLMDELTIHEAAAPATVMQATLIALAVGAMALIPALIWLYRTYQK